MTLLTHHFAFPGRICQSTFPDLSLTTLDGGGRTVSAHRVILAAVSTKLGDICKEGGEVVIRNIGFLVLKRIVRLVYVGSLQVEGSEALGDVRDGLDMLKVDLEFKTNGEHVGLLRKVVDNVKREVMRNSEVSGDASVEVGTTAINNNDKCEANENVDSDVTIESDLSVSATEQCLSRGVLARLIELERLDRTSNIRAEEKTFTIPAQPKYCRKCDRIFLSLGSLERHIENHAVNEISEAEGIKPSRSGEKSAERGERKRNPLVNGVIVNIRSVRKSREKIVENGCGGGASRSSDSGRASDISLSKLDNICKPGGKKIYSKETGSTCHQCRTKTTDTKTVCRSGKCVRIRGQFCGRCLLIRYGEDAREALLDPVWKCPPCRGCCNCSLCRKKLVNT